MSVTAARGFTAGGTACGIKPAGVPDLALVAAAPAAPVSAAAVFTTNRAAAAPVQVSRRHLAASAGRASAVVLSSGCANAATGPEGLLGAERTCRAAAAALGVAPETVLVCSTGLIGTMLPVERIELALPGLAARLGNAPEDALAAASAILTTDTHAKQALARRGEVVAGGMAKGAGMIAPNLATMLAVLTTDAAASPQALSQALQAAVADSFNALSVDGCTSTNDTVIALASGAAGELQGDDLAGLLGEICADLAMQLAGDAEGTTRVARIAVVGAASDADARLAARAVAESLLVKASLYGADPYWGRVVSELGASGAAFEIERVRVSYGGEVVCAAGSALEHDASAVAAAFEADVLELGCDLGLGQGSASVLTTDLGHGYIDENMRTS